MRQLDYSSVKKDILRLCVFYSFTKCHIIKVYISVSTLAIASEGDFHGRKRESHWTRITECLTVVSELKTKLTILRCLVMRLSQCTSGMERSSLPFDIKIGIHSRRKLWRQTTSVPFISIACEDTGSPSPPRNFPFGWLPKCLLMPAQKSEGVESSLCVLEREKCYRIQNFRPVYAAVPRNFLHVFF